MYPSKEDIQFFYNLGVYTKADVMSFVEQGSITKEEAKEILTE
ncbi:XkdX family protein [Enterococcus faecium]|nr:MULTISPECIES: XkdX family protein [Enterococcus]EGP5179228.1 XkdX family protein [Enterococcus faecium]EGP5661399.1 XkdX family protein [Enterococcus faecium]EGW2153397.1 XkdX family protein [Enterococcus faecium]EHH1654777.1 XkdX family protein [Enterococcus faecium]EME7147144.1 XkdX family protein [Enterococcus faecium]